MAKTMKKVISVLLALVLVTGTFAGCGKSNKEETAAITATAVKYTKSGQYTTTVSSKKVDLSGINADNVEVRYFDPTADPEAAKAESTEAAAEEATTEATEEINLEEVYPLSAKVESVKATDKKSYEITFTDDKATELITGSYIVLFKGVEGDDNTASVEVEFPEITLTPDVENVVSDATQAKVTLAIDGSTFEDGISEKDIYLDNAFSDMKIESVSSSDKNLTVQLKGSPVRNAAGAYQWGSVNIKPSGIKDGYADVTSKVNIQLATVNMDATTLKFENGNITADLKVYGVVDINTLTKDNIVIDGATVEAAEKADDNTVKLTLSADGVKSVNDFADLIGGKAMTLGDYETTVSVSQASFYPVFDYVEEDGDNLKLTLKLYANNGTFDKNIKADAISFADDFEGAKAESIKVDSDTVATLILSVPANGQTTETFKMNGTVTLAAGALTNAWGDKTSKETSYTRDYSGESLGRDVTLNTETLQEIAKYTSGKDTLFGQICYWGGVGGQVFSIAKAVLEFTGVLKSEHQQVMESLAEISKKTDTIISNQYVIMDMLNELKGDIKQGQTEPYQENVEKLNSAIENLSEMFANGALYMALEDAVEAGKLEALPDFSGLKGERLIAEKEKYKKLYVPNMDEMTAAEITDYNVRLVHWIEANKNNTEKYGMAFKNFDIRYDNLYTVLDATALQLSRTDDTNPLSRYDEICAMKYNFDSQCYPFRRSLRETAKLLLAKGLGLVAYYNMIEKYPANSDFDTVQKDVTAAAKRIDDVFALNVGYPVNRIHARPHIEVVKKSNTYISDLAVGGDTTPGAAKKALTDRGYTVYDRDLNEKAGGHYVYIGYKTTTDFNKAIKTVLMSSNVSASPKKNWSVVPAYGDSSFVESKGDLNHKAGGLYVYLYYDYRKSVNGSVSQEAVTGLYVNATKTDSVCDMDMNKWAGGSYLYLHLNKGTGKITTNQMLETDPEYYPFSYVLGKKVAICTKSELATQNIIPGSTITGALQDTTGRYRNWTEEEMKAFAKRMTNSTLSQELASAGLNGASRNLAMNIKTKKYNSSLTTIYGDYMNLNSNQVSHCDQDKDFAQFYDKIESEKIPSYGDFTYFMLFDYAPNDRKKSEAIDKPKVTSLLTDYARVSPNRTSPRKSEIDTITIDVTREPLTVEELGKKYASQTTKKSANYGIDSTGRISLYVPEKDRSWFSYGSNDNRAITIAVSSEATSPYKISDEAYDSLVDILVDICERNGIKMLIWNADKDARVNHTDGSNMTVLRDFSTTSDGPGDYLYEKMGDIAEVVNRRLGVIW